MHWVYLYECYMFWLDSNKGYWFKVISLNFNQIYCLPVMFKVIYSYGSNSSAFGCIWHILKYFNTDTVILESYIKGPTIESFVVPYFSIKCIV